MRYEDASQMGAFQGSEPDARNAAAVARVLAVGFELGPRVRFESAHGPKDAQLVFLTRARAADLGVLI